MGFYEKEIMPYLKNNGTDKLIDALDYILSDLNMIKYSNYAILILLLGMIYCTDTYGIRYINTNMKYLIFFFTIAFFINRVLKILFINKLFNIIDKYKLEIEMSLYGNVFKKDKFSIMRNIMKKFDEELSQAIWASPLDLINAAKRKDRHELNVLLS